MSGAYFDYRFRFPITGLAAALQALAALRTAGLLGAGEEPDNMLGDPRDASGNAVDPASGNVAWKGRPGAAPSSDPASYYIHIRSIDPPSALPFDPATYGMTPTSAAESAVVLGAWA